MYRSEAFKKGKKLNFIFVIVLFSVILQQSSGKSYATQQNCHAKLLKMFFECHIKQRIVDSNLLNMDDEKRLVVILTKARGL